MKPADASPVDRWTWLAVIASDYGPPKPTTRHVLHVLALHMNQHGESAWPSQALLARRCGLSERAVRTQLQAARRFGWVAIYSKQPKGQGWRLHEYVATIPDAVPAEAIPECPWADPEFERAERPSVRLAPQQQGPEAGSARYDADGPTSSRPGERKQRKRAELHAEGAEPRDTTCGTSRHNVRNEVPTKYSIKYSEKYSGEGGLSPTPPQKTEKEIEEGRQAQLRKLERRLATQPKN